MPCLPKKMLSGVMAMMAMEAQTDQLKEGWSSRGGGRVHTGYRSQLADCSPAFFPPVRCLLRSGVKEYA